MYMVFFILGSISFFEGFVSEIFCYYRIYREIVIFEVIY